MSDPSSKKTFTIVVPIYYNELNISPLFERLHKLYDHISDVVFEYIFVDDGSRDNSLVQLNQLKKDHPELTIKIIKLSRNFGSFNAISAGLSQASGDCVGIIAADLQDPPELFTEMYKKWKQGKKVIMAVRRKRNDPLVSKFLSAVFYKALRLLALPQMPDGGFDFVLLDKKVVKVINGIQEKNGSTMALIAWLGFDHEEIKYDRAARELGKSMWTWNKKFKLFVDIFVSYTYFPIRAITSLGFLFGFTSFAYALYILFTKVSQGIEVPGYSSLAIITLTLFSFTFVSLGIVGEYLFRTLDEVRKRPNYIIDEIYE